MAGAFRGAFFWNQKTPVAYRIRLGSSGRVVFNINLRPKFVKSVEQTVLFVS